MQRKLYAEEQKLQREQLGQHSTTDAGTWAHGPDTSDDITHNTISTLIPIAAGTRPNRGQTTAQR